LGHQDRIVGRTRLSAPDPAIGTEDGSRLVTLGRVTDLDPFGPEEPHAQGSSRLGNILRAGVLGANDGIVSTAGIVLGVAGATTDRSTIATAGIAGLVAGALSMAVGEYVSVSAQRDADRAQLAKERRELREDPDGELLELAAIYEQKGLSAGLAREVAEELTARGAFRAHAEAELNIDPDALVNPWAAALSSMTAFIAGALLPLVAVLLPPSTAARVPVTVVAVIAALALTGAVSARVGGGDRRVALLRTVGGGALAMAVTYTIGRLVGIAV